MGNVAFAEYNKILDRIRQNNEKPNVRSGLDLGWMSDPLVIGFQDFAFDADDISGDLSIATVRYALAMRTCAEALAAAKEDAKKVDLLGAYVWLYSTMCAPGCDPVAQAKLRSTLSEFILSEAVRADAKMLIGRLSALKDWDRSALLAGTSAGRGLLLSRDAEERMLTFRIQDRTVGVLATMNRAEFFYPWGAREAGRQNLMSKLDSFEYDNGSPSFAMPGDVLIRVLGDGRELIVEHREVGGQGHHLSLPGDAFRRLSVERERDDNELMTSVTGAESLSPALENAKRIVILRNEASLVDAADTSAAGMAAHYISRMYPEKPVLLLNSKQTGRDAVSGFCTHRDDRVAGKLGSRVAAIIDRRSSRTNDEGLLVEFEDQFSGAGVKSIQVTDATESIEIESKYTDIIVITAHAEAEIHKLLDVIGPSLRGKIVMMNSCSAPIGSSLSRRLQLEYGALATMCYAEKIPRQSLKKAMATLCSRLTEVRDSTALSLGELIDLMTTAGTHPYWVVGQSSSFQRSEYYYA